MLTNLLSMLTFASTFCACTVILLLFYKSILLNSETETEFLCILFQQSTTQLYRLPVTNLEILEFYRDNSLECVIWFMLSSAFKWLFWLIGCSIVWLFLTNLWRGGFYVLLWDLSNPTLLENFRLLLNSELICLD